MDPEVAENSKQVKKYITEAVKLIERVVVTKPKKCTKVYFLSDFLGTKVLFVIL